MALTLAVQAAPVAYSYVRGITIDHTKVPNTDQSSYPLLVNGTYASLASTANGGHIVNANGYDMAFGTDSACQNVLPYERESWSATTGQLVAWVQVPLLSHAADTTIYVCYGSPSVTTDQSNKTAVWDSNYTSVWHLGDGTNLSLMDSTTNGNAGVNQGATPATGEIGGSAYLNGSSAIAISNPMNAPVGSGPLTLETWFKLPNGSPNQEDLLSTGANVASGSRAALFLGNGYIGVEFQNFYVAGSFSPDTNWHHIAAVFPSGATQTSSSQIYLDGSPLLAGGNSGTLNIVNSELVAGRYPTYPGAYYTGWLDEARVSTAARSADWIATEYSNQSNPNTFYTIGPESTP